MQACFDVAIDRGTLNNLQAESTSNLRTVAMKLPGLIKLTEALGKDSRYLRALFLAVEAELLYRSMTIDN